ncbi:MAG: DNA polymerase Y family protein, partial [Ruaniaceae bacterium]|nr:DNA polymerase Y family protein [Ruaniaceae bacterium]
LFDEPRPVRHHDARGGAVTVDSVGLISAAPCLICVEGETREIEAWSGPWPVSERWWSERQRVDWLQVVPVGGAAILVAVREGGAVMEGTYD